MAKVQKVEIKVTDSQKAFLKDVISKYNLSMTDLLVKGLYLELIALGGDELLIKYVNS